MGKTADCPHMHGAPDGINGVRLAFREPCARKHFYRTGVPSPETSVLIMVALCHNNVSTVDTIQLQFKESVCIACTLRLSSVHSSPIVRGATSGYEHLISHVTCNVTLGAFQGILSMCWEPLVGSTSRCV